MKFKIKTKFKVSNNEFLVLKQENEINWFAYLEIQDSVVACLKYDVQVKDDELIRGQWEEAKPAPFNSFAEACSSIGDLPDWKRVSSSFIALLDLEKRLPQAINLDDLIKEAK